MNDEKWNEFVRSTSQRMFEAGVDMDAEPSDNIEATFQGAITIAIFIATEEIGLPKKAAIAMINDAVEGQFSNNLNRKLDG